MDWILNILAFLCIIHCVAGGSSLVNTCYSKEFNYKELTISCKEPLMVVIKSAEYYSLNPASCSPSDYTKTVSSVCKQSVNCSMPLPYQGDIGNCLKCLRVTYDCNPGSCLKPPAPIFGSANITSSAPVKTAVGYSCNTDFDLVGSTSSICKVVVSWNFKSFASEAKYTWSSINKPVCSLAINKCPKPRSPTVYPTGSYEGNCYEFVKEIRTWSEALKDCKEKNGELLTDTKTKYFASVFGRTQPALNLEQKDVHQTDQFWINRTTTSPLGGKLCLTERIVMNKKDLKPATHYPEAENCSMQYFYICKYKIQVPPRCGEIDVPKFAFKENEEGDNIGNTVTFNCLEGFRLVGDRQRKCQPDGTWSGKNPNCTAVDCLIPPRDPSGQMNIYYTTTNYLSLAHYSCSNNDFILVGDSVRRCSGSGIWSGSLPRCQRKPDQVKTLTKCAYDTVKNNEEWLNLTCKKPYMIRVENIYYYNDKNPDCWNLDFTNNVKAECDRTLSCSLPLPYKGYRWSCLKCVRVKFDCVLATCPKIAVPTFGSSNITGEAPYRSVAEYKCETGFTMKGTHINKCWLRVQISSDVKLSRYVWIQRPPSCSIKIDQCPQRTSLTKNPMGVLEGSCFEFIQLNKTWQDAKEECKRQKGRLFIREFYDVLRYPIGSANPPLKYVKQGFRLKARLWTGQTRRKENGDPECMSVLVSKSSFGGMLLLDDWKSCTDMYNFVCEYVVRSPKKCSALSTPRDAISVGSDNMIGSEITFKCIDGYKKNGTGIRKCLPNGEWDGETPSCKVVKCSIPSVDTSKVMMVHYDRTEVYHDAFYFCPSNYDIVGKRVRVCQETGTWSGDTPQCVLRAKTTPQTPQTQGLGVGALVAAIIVPIIVVGIAIIIVIFLIRRGAVSVPLIHERADGVGNPAYLNYRRHETDGTV